MRKGPACKLPLTREPWLPRTLQAFFPLAQCEGARADRLAARVAVLMTAGTLAAGMGLMFFAMMFQKYPLVCHRALCTARLGLELNVADRRCRPRSRLPTVTPL